MGNQPKLNLPVLHYLFFSVLTLWKEVGLFWHLILLCAFP